MKTTRSDTQAELRKKLEIFVIGGPHACHCPRSEDNGCTCAIKDEYVEKVIAFVKAHTNKQIESVLDRLYGEREAVIDPRDAERGMEFEYFAVNIAAIEAERKRLGGAE